MEKRSRLRRLRLASLAFVSAVSFTAVATVPAVPAVAAVPTIPAVPAILASRPAKAPKTAKPFHAYTPKTTKTTGPLSWCADEFETLPNGLCHIDGGLPNDGSRTLVVFLHGAIAKDVDWQWLQERALARQAKQSKFEAVFARAPLGAGGYLWPGTTAAQRTSEQDLIDEWTNAKEFLEKRSGKPYDEVFLMGFSSGAYFVSSLVLRGRTTFDGYAVFAGGAAGPSAAEVSNKPPVYVGVCTSDEPTAPHSRAFGGALAARGWPHRVDEQKVGHMFSDIHVSHAVTYLRALKHTRNSKHARNDD